MRDIGPRSNAFEMRRASIICFIYFCHDVIPFSRDACVGDMLRRYEVPEKTCQEMTSTAISTAVSYITRQTSKCPVGPGLVMSNHLTIFGGSDINVTCVWCPVQFRGECV